MLWMHMKFFIRIADSWAEIDKFLDFLGHIPIYDIGAIGENKHKNENSSTGELLPEVPRLSRNQKLSTKYDFL